MPIEDFFRFLERRSPPLAVRGTLEEWRRGCTDAYPSIAPMLVRTGSVANHWPADREGCPPRRVVRHGKSVLAVCDQDYSTTLELSPDQIILHQLDLSKFRKQLATALGVNIAHSSIGDRACWMDVGDLKVKPGLVVRVILLSHRSPSELLSSLHTIQTSSAHPILSITPTDHNWSPELPEAAKRARGLVTVANDIIAMHDGRWCRGDVFDQALDRIRERTNEIARSPHAGRKRLPKRSTRAANIESVREVLREEAWARFDRIKAARKSGGEPVTLDRLRKKALATAAGIKAYAISPIFKDPSAGDLAPLLSILTDHDELLKWGSANYKSRRKPMSPAL
jgi:hypothetical protein